MKTISSLIIRMTFTSLFVATTSVSAQHSPGLEASDPHWGPSPTAHPSTYATPVDRGQAANNPPTSEVSALFRNTGQKAIKSVTWKYLFYKDEQMKKLLASYTFHSSKSIEPGAAVLLKDSVSATSEPRHWTNYHAVLIARIRYADGTVWQAGESKK